MSQVHISGHEHTVTVNHDGGDLTYVIEKAQRLWEETRPPERPPGPAFGFQAREQLPTNRSQYGMASFRHGNQPVVEP